MLTRVLTSRYGRRSVNITNCVSFVAGLRSGALPPFPLYTFIAYVEKNSPLLSLTADLNIVLTAGKIIV
jgi:hypothetical protein